MTRRSMPCKVVRCRLLEVLRGSGRAKTEPTPSTSCLLMKLASCPLQILWPLHKPERVWSCSEIRSNSNSRSRQLTLLAQTSPRCNTSWAATRRCPPMPASSFAETWRLCREICDFTSEMFYEGRLAPRSGLNLQKISGPTSFAGSGLWIAPVIHEGNQNSSDEEVDTVVEIVQQLLQPGVRWTDMYGNTHPLCLNDVLIVSPYNAQVYKLTQRLPGARIGTVDKFQGQEAPVVIYSMATSSPEDAPRGMEFLYSANRFNVATSRARGACILAANPRLFEPDCRTPRQMRLAN